MHMLGSCVCINNIWDALHKIGRFRNVPTVGTNLENRTFRRNGNVPLRDADCSAVLVAVFLLLSFSQILKNWKQLESVGFPVFLVLRSFFISWTGTNPGISLIFEKGFCWFVNPLLLSCLFIREAWVCRRAASSNPIPIFVTIQMWTRHRGLWAWCI